MLLEALALSFLLEPQGERRWWLTASCCTLRGLVCCVMYGRRRPPLHKPWPPEEPGAQTDCKTLAACCNTQDHRAARTHRYEQLSQMQSDTHARTHARKHTRDILSHAPTNTADIMRIPPRVSLFSKTIINYSKRKNAEM